MKILIAVDGSIYTDHALEFLTTRTGLLAGNPEIELLSVVSPLPPGALRFIERDTLNEYYSECAEKTFKSVRKFMRKSKIEYKEVYVVGDPDEEVANEAKRIKADLIVMGSRGRSSLKGLLLGSVTRGVLARTKEPMLIVRSDRMPKKEAMRVGIAIDGSPTSKAAAKYVVSNLALFGEGAKFYLTNVTSDVSLTLLAGLSTGGPRALSETDLEAIKKASFEKASEEVIPIFEKAGLKWEPVSLEGHAGDALVKFAEKKKLDLMVMGSHGYGRFKSAVLGSTAMRFIAKGEIPVLLIRK